MINTTRNLFQTVNFLSVHLLVIQRLLHLLINDISTKGVVINTFGQTPSICNIFLLPNINSVCAVCITQNCKPDDEFLFLPNPYPLASCMSPHIPQYNYSNGRHCKLLFLHTMIKYNSELYIITSYASNLH